jgi:GNAT superfamily N-acetyltransferase
MVIVDVNYLNLQKFYPLFKEVMEEGYGQFPPELRQYFLKKEYPEEMLKLWLERNFRKILMALDDQEQVLGFLIGDHTYGGVAFISWLGVKKEYRKQGIGTALLKKYEEYARIKKAHLIELFTIDDVIPFYAHNGFVEIGRRNPGFFGQKNVILNKKLSDFNRENIALTPPA